MVESWFWYGPSVLLAHTYFHAARRRNMSNAPTSRKRKFEDTPYDPNDANAVNAFWKAATVTPGGAVKATLDALKAARGRGPGTRWQTKIDAALRDWLKAHPVR